RLSVNLSLPRISIRSAASSRSNGPYASSQDGSLRQLRAIYGYYRSPSIDGAGMEHQPRIRKSLGSESLRQKLTGE
ncbi:unnamed protein product, partial [Urochloa humidicola]